MLEVGARVRYIHDDPPDIRESGYYPPIGTGGTIIHVSPSGYEVKWDSGTQGNGIWWCDHGDVEPIIPIIPMYVCTKCPKDRTCCDNCAYMVALNNYHAALRELEESCQKFAVHVKNTYGIDLYK